MAGDWLQKIVSGVKDFAKDTYSGFVRDVTGGDIDPRKAPPPKYTGRGVTVEHTQPNNDRTQNSKSVNHTAKFFKDLENGIQDIDKYIAQYMKGINPQNRQEAINAVSVIKPIVNRQYRIVAPQINDALDDYLQKNFPIGKKQ